MLPNPLLETNGNIDSLTLEKAYFKRRYFAWKETNRQFTARYSWNKTGQLTSVEENDEVFLYAYNVQGHKTACYRMNTAGGLISREIWEWDQQNKLSRRVLTSSDPESEEILSYDHDDSGRMIAERNGSRIRVEKYDSDGRLELEYIYDGEKPDLITEYSYNSENQLISVIIKDPGGVQHRETLYSYNNGGQRESEKTINSEGRTIREEIYAYGATQGKRWLERVCWIPLGNRKRKRRPSEVIYRSFTLGGEHSRSAPGTPQSAAFENGVYTGPIVDGEPNGKGVFQYNDSSRYEGEFRNGSMEGDGILTWPDGRVMEGTFRGGLLEGSGTCIWTDGSRYIGAFSNGKMHGPGVFTWSDGTRFEGLFEEGKRTDQGAWERMED